MGMIFLSDEDVDVRRLIKCWLDARRATKSPPSRATGEGKATEEDGEEQQGSAADPDVEHLAQWIEDCFYKALDWVLDRQALVVDTSMVGVVKNGLSHIDGAKTKADFVVGLIRGLGGNLELEVRKDFARMCYDLVGEVPPSNKAPLDCFAERGVLASFAGRSQLEGEFSRLAQSGAIIQTASVQRNIAMVQPWVERMEPFILVGPEGCGKTMLLTHCFRQAGRSTSVTTLHCNAQTTATHVIQKIQQACSLFSTNTGRVYRPRESERLVLYLKDINLPKPDKYDTCMLVAFLQQLITEGGFYDDNLEFLGLERVHIVASMNPSTTVGRHVLSSRFTAAVRIAYIDYPEADELVGVYAGILERAFLGEDSMGAVPVVDDPRWANPSNLRQLASSMVDLFTTVKSKFSVDDYRHYQFTPRDLTQWVLGLLRYDLGSEDLLDVMAYEAQRLFRDRLVDQESKTRFDGLLSNVLRKDWSHRLEGITRACYTSLAGPVSALPTSLGEGKDADENKAADAGDQPATASSKLLVRMGMDDFVQVVQHGMMMYEREEKELKIKLFDEALEHMAQVDRVLSKPGGSMLLVGRSGVGRRTATQLVAHMQGMAFFTPNMLGANNKQANLKLFQGELKQVMQCAGVDGQRSVLYVEDHQVFAEEVLETLNSLLCSGEVPGLYKHEELVPLLDPLKEKMQDEVGDGSVRTPYDFFVRRVQANLHIVVAMDPEHPRFLMRCESNPALYKACAILWFGEWSRDSVASFPALLLPEFFGADAPEGWDADALQTAASRIHGACRERGATPRDLVSFLQCFKHLHASKAGAIEKKVAQFLGGLSKLEEAAKTVDVLNEDANVQREELQRKQAAADESMEEITEALQQASKTRKETETLSEELKEAEKETMARKATIEDELSEIQPVLESAKEAVGKIKSDNLNELRSLKMPPDPVRDVLSAVLMLLGISDTTWSSMRRFLGNRGVKEDILNYDTHRITPEIRAQVMKLLRNSANSFERATIQRVSVAAAPFAAWVKANIRYSLVLDKIQPLEAELDEATRALEGAQQRMQECEEELAEIDDRVKNLQDNFKKTTKEAAELNIRLQDTEATLAKAEKLLGELGGEQERWSLQADELREVMGTLPVRILLSAAFVTYLGKTPEDVREREMRVWSRDFCGLGGGEGGEGKEADESKNGAGAAFDVKRIMSTESEMLVWKSQEGLPGDDLSMENAIIILNNPQSQCPFVIDPASGATRWLKAHLARDEATPFEVVAQQDSRFVNQVELAVRFGKTLVVVEVDGVDPMLYPLIRHDLRRQGPRWVVQIGDKLIDYNDKFRLLLVTRNPDPQLPPDASSLVCEVNFTVTRSGLEGQLLGVTVQHEQPELEQQKSEVLRQEEEFKVRLSELEKELLDTLAASEGNLLENQALLDTLTKTKETSAEVSASLEKSAAVSIRLDQERNQYRAFAHAGSRLYFTIQALSRANHMYQFSLESFVQLFRATLQGTSQTGDIETHMEGLIAALEKRVLYFVGRALFKADRLMFAMHLVRESRPQLFQEGEFEFLLGEGAAAGGLGNGDDDGGESKASGSGGGGGGGSLPSWAAPDRAVLMAALQESFPRLVAKLDLQGAHASEWTRWGRSAECEKLFPASTGLTAFQRLLVTHVLRPDRLESAMALFCCDALGVESLAPPPTTVPMLVEGEDKAGPETPILLIGTPGADPTGELKDYASKVVGAERYCELAMGGGQTDDALSMLRDAARNGEWLCLKNLHLVSAWIPRLEKEFNALGSKHDDFRLWLTTEETAEFAPILLQQSLKVTFEAPPGIKKNLQRTFESWTEDQIAEGGALQTRLMFLLAWLHALMQERRTYIPQGWTKFYEFSLGDLRSGTGVVSLALDSFARAAEGGEGKDGDGDSSVDWAYIHGLMENSVYGGRIDNPFDLRVLRAYLERYFTDRMVSGRGATLSHDIQVPEAADKAALLEWAAQLEDTDAPAIFGLPANIERSVLRARSAATVGALQALGASRAAANHFDREEWCRKLQPVIKMWQQLVQSGDLLAKPSQDGVRRRGTGSGLDEGGSDDEPEPIAMFVLLEEQRAHKIVSTVDRAVRSIAGVVSGQGLLTPQTQADGAALMQHQVPAAWEALWEGPVSPMEWLRGLASRRAALQQWSKLSRKGRLLDEPLDLADLFNPGTFLNALRQQTARRMRCSMDGLALVSRWDERSLGDAALPIRLCGLLMQGAVLEEGRLVEPAADAPEVAAAPTCGLAFVEAAAAERSDGHTVSLPLYKGLSRECLLLELDAPMRPGDAAADWVTGGAAFFLSS